MFFVVVRRDALSVSLWTCWVTHCSCRATLLANCFTLLSKPGPCLLYRTPQPPVNGRCTDRTCALQWSLPCNWYCRVFTVLYRAILSRNFIVRQNRRTQLRMLYTATHRITDTDSAPLSSLTSLLHTMGAQIAKLLPYFSLFQLSGLSLRFWYAIDLILKLNYRRHSH